MPVVPGGSDAAAERGAVQPGGGPGIPSLLVLLGQQQHEGHGQGTVVEAVHVGVIPLLRAGRAGEKREQQRRGTRVRCATLNFYK